MMTLREKQQKALKLLVSVRDYRGKKASVSIANSILNIDTTPDWDSELDMEYLIEELQPITMLYAICQKCVEDGFDLLEYYVHEVPYGDAECEIWNFVHIKDIENKDNKKYKGVGIRGIDFMVKRNGEVIPLYMNWKTSIQEERKFCQEAVSVCY